LKHLAGILSLLISYTLFAADDVTVKDLNQGSCWVHENGNARIADFNSGLSHLVEQHQVQQIVSQFSGDERPSHLDTMVHCSGGGVAVVMNFKVNQKSYCLWTKPTKNDFELVSLGRSMNDSGPCDGITLGKVSLKQIGTVDQDKIQNFFESKISEGVIKSYSASGKWWNVTGNESFQFKEEFLKDDLMKSGLFENFEFDHLRHYQGEFLRLNDLSL